MWILSPNISCAHGFSTRHGGVSGYPFNTLNLGGSQDDITNIQTNRALALRTLNLDSNNVCTLKQVHGTEVRFAKIGAQEGDALVTNRRNLILAVSVADCYPILFYDATQQVIGAAHAGWRGTVGKIVANTIYEMAQLGAKPENIQVAVGQGISQKNFEVGNEVLQQFEAAGFPSTCWHANKIDLIKCNTHVLLQNNILEKNIWAMNRCTFEDDFFSYRQDKGITGRMWAVISMQEV
jgi:YfiH family protein